MTPRAPRVGAAGRPALSKVTPTVGVAKSIAPNRSPGRAVYIDRATMMGQLRLDTPNDDPGFGGRGEMWGWRAGGPFLETVGAGLGLYVTSLQTSGANPVLRGRSRGITLCLYRAP
jgi:hypothetical protein